MSNTARKPAIALVPPPGPGTALARGLADIQREAGPPRPFSVSPEAIVAEMAMREEDREHAALAADNQRLEAELADARSEIRGLKAELAKADDRAVEAARKARVEAHATAKHGGRLTSILALS